MAGFGTVALKWERGEGLPPKMPPHSLTLQLVAASSSNLPPAHAAANLLLRSDVRSEARDWLVRWYQQSETAALCHRGAEFPSTTYWHAGGWSSGIAILWAVEHGYNQLAALARADLERQYVGTVIMTTPWGAFCGPGARFKTSRSRSTEDLRYLLVPAAAKDWKPGDWSVRHVSRLLREARRRKLADDFFCRAQVREAIRAWLDRRERLPDLDAVLNSIIAGPAPITVNIYEDGQEAWYERSPVLYDNPQYFATALNEGRRLYAANPREQLLAAKRFKGEEFFPGEAVQFEIRPDKLVAELLGKKWRFEAPRPQGRLLKTFHIRGRDGAEQAPRPEPGPPPSGPAPSALVGRVEKFAFSVRGNRKRLAIALQQRLSNGLRESSIAAADALVAAFGTGAPKRAEAERLRTEVRQWIHQPG